MSKSEVVVLIHYFLMIFFQEHWTHFTLLFYQIELQKNKLFLVLSYSIARDSYIP